MQPTLDILAYMPGPFELVIIGLIGLLIFGKRLPEVGKSLGRSIVEFKKGLHGIEEDLDASVNRKADMLPPPRKNDTPVNTSTPQKDPAVAHDDAGTD
jgi:sec-independent protein translocase protein TatA